MKDIVLIVANLLLNYKFTPHSDDMETFKNDFVNNKKVYSVYKFDPALKLDIECRNAQIKRRSRQLSLLKDSVTADAFIDVCVV